MKRAFEVFLFYLRLTLMLIWLVISSVAVIPLAIVRWKNPENNFLFARLYGAPALFIMGIRLKVEGVENLGVRPAIFVANHQSGIDLATISSIYPLGAIVIGKKELRYIPGFGLMFEAFGNALINRQDRSNALGDLRGVVETMKKKNHSAFIFPEGTRNASGEGLLPFKKGAFYMAIQAGVPIVPMVFSTLEKTVSFKRKFARSGTVVMKVLPPIPTEGLTQADVGAVLHRTRTLMLETLKTINEQADAINQKRISGA